MGGAPQRRYRELGESTRKSNENDKEFDMSGSIDGNGSAQPGKKRSWREMMGGKRTKVWEKRK